MRREIVQELVLLSGLVLFTVVLIGENGNGWVAALGVVLIVLRVARLLRRVTRSRRQRAASGTIDR